MNICHGHVQVKVCFIRNQEDAKRTRLSEPDDNDSVRVDEHEKSIGDQILDTIETITKNKTFETCEANVTRKIIGNESDNK